MQCQNCGEFLDREEFRRLRAARGQPYRLSKICERCECAARIAIIDRRRERKREELAARQKLWASIYG